MMTLNTLVLSTLHQHWHAFHLNVTQISGEARRVCMKAAGVGGWECKGIITLNYQFAYWNPSLMHRFWSVCVCNITDWVKDWSASSEIPLFNANDDLKVFSSSRSKMFMLLVKWKWIGNTMIYMSMSNGKWGKFVFNSIICRVWVVRNVSSKTVTCKFNALESLCFLDAPVNAYMQLKSIVEIQSLGFCR